MRPADRIFRNGKVVTVDRNFTICSAIAVAGDRIIATGSDAEVSARAGEGTEVSRVPRNGSYRSDLARSLPPVPTLGELNREPHWLWVYCARWQCGHKAPTALAPLIIRWGGRHLLRHATTLGAVHALRPQGRDVADAELGRRKERKQIAALPEVRRAKRRLGGNPNRQVDK